MGRPILGRSGVVEKLKRDRVLSYMGERYSAPNLILTAAGQVNHDELVQIAKRVFTGLPDHKSFKAYYGDGAAYRYRWLGDAYY